MTPKSVALEIKITDLPQVKALMDQAKARIAELDADRAVLVDFATRCVFEDWRGPEPWYVAAARDVLTGIGEL